MLLMMFLGWACRIYSPQIIHVPLFHYFTCGSELQPKLIVVDEIRTYFNTCRTLEVTEVSYLVILSYMVIVSRRKIAPNCLQTRCSVSKQHHHVSSTLFGNFAFKTHTKSYMLGLPGFSQFREFFRRLFNKYRQ